jgi:8-oxo-dGTP pyrophosphatase MutT (NUDIX family)
MSNIVEPREKRGAVAVIVRNGRLLVIRRSRRVVAPRTFCFPGGAIEADESEVEALVREIREELAVTIAPERRIWRSVTPWGVRLAWWLGRLEPDAPIAPNPAEVESVHWLAPQETAELPDLLESNRHFLAALASGEIELPI